jgi:hypothetical protein
MAAHGISRKLARRVAWSTTMATATYGIEIIYESQQWIIDQIQEVNVKVANIENDKNIFTHTIATLL